MAASAASSRRDVSLFGHAAKDVVVPAREVLVRIAERAQARRRRDDRDDRGGFLEREVLGGLVEVHPRRGLDAVGAVVERDVVGVEGEDLVLRVALLELKRDQPLLDLALQPLGARAREHAAAHVVLQEQHPRDLLRDRAGAAHAMAGAEVADRR